MTNDLFRDLLENRIPGHETPRTVTISITPEINTMSIHGNQYTRTEYAALMQAAVNNAWARMEKIRQAMSMFSVPMWIDYGARQGLTGLERAHFNDAVEKMTRTTGWNREDSARNLGHIMDVAESAERIPPVPTRFYLNQRVEADPPADPRARALWAKQQQGHGPAMTPLRVRGRTTHYKEKG